ncbi:hypothetical protein PTKIN_Ptkin09bG0180600 [Pterospermum kingtungense]
MDDSAEKKELEVMMVNGTDQPERRSARRRLVQSTLFPHKSPEIEPKVDQKANECEVDNKDGECKEAKEKLPIKTTPKKKGMNNLLESEDTSPPPIPNLRLEAKLTAEENSQMFAGRKIHPFFTSWKAGKRIQETAGEWKNGCLLDRSNKGINIGPIHVFERTQDDVVLDWKHWAYSEKTSDTGCSIGGLFTSVFESYVGALCLDNLPSVSHFSEKSFIENKLSDEYLIQGNDLLGTSLAIPAVLVDEQLESYQPSKSSEGDEQVHEVAIFSNVESSELEQQSRLLRESIQPDNSLWTNKYQPKSAAEVCGNTESVKFMSEWLHLWRERSFPAIKACNSIDKSNMLEHDEDYCESDFDSENIDGEDRPKVSLKLSTSSHVSDLTISGKSAAIHACAKEQGFKVLEMRKIHLVHMEHLGNVSVMIVRLAVVKLKFKPLILFEDVDISFPEDRGFVAAIQQIAEKAKGPVILTSNGNNLVLPDNLDRLELCFTMPSQEELFHHLCMICSAEKASIQPHLLEQLIKCCQGDIRKTIMHLQFWCQSKKYQKDRKLQKTYGLLLFNIEAGHAVLPTIVPWGFPSQLSELVEQEIANAVSMMEENLTLMEVMEEEFENNLSNGLGMNNKEIDGIEAKKEVILSRNICIHDCNEFINPSYTAHDFHSSSGTPVSFSRRTRRRNLDVVMSSDSEDEDLDKQPSLVSCKNVNGELFIKEDCRLLSDFPSMQNCVRPLTDELHCFEVEKLEDSGFQCSETTNNLEMETCKSADVSYVPESSFFPETEIVEGMELSSRC